MPKKLKVDLKDLKVNSFVTSLDDGVKGKVKGGTGTINPFICSVSCFESCLGNCPTDTCETDCGSCVTCATCHPTCIIKLC